MIDSEKITVVLTLATDFHATVQAITDAHREQQVILEAVRGRIFAEKQRAEARQMELQAIIADSSRNVTVRNLSQREFESLSSATYEPTTDERAAFDAVTRTGMQAVTDLRRTRESLRAALADAKAELEKLRGETLGKVDIDIMERWIVGKEGATTITFDDLKTALADQKTGSDLDCSTTPKRKTRRKAWFRKKTFM